MNKSRSGFTIVELLIVIVVIGILATIVIVAYSGVQARARQAQLISSADAVEKAAHMALSTTGEFPHATDFSYHDSDNYQGSTCLGPPSDYLATNGWKDGVCTTYGTVSGPDQYSWRAKYNVDINNQLKTQINTIPSGVFDTVKYNCAIGPSCGGTNYEYSRGISYTAVCSTSVTPSICYAYIIYAQYGDIDCGGGKKRIQYDDARRVTACDIQIQR